jgi:hypothetical protein
MVAKCYILVVSLEGKGRERWLLIPYVVYISSRQNQSHSQRLKHNDCTRLPRPKRIRADKERYAGQMYLRKGGLMDKHYCLFTRHFNSIEKQTNHKKVAYPVGHDLISALKFYMDKPPRKAGVSWQLNN